MGGNWIRRGNSGKFDELVLWSSKMSLTGKQLIQKHSQAWQEATVHPFLEGCKLGAIASEQFNTWLVQDYLFVKELTRLAARVLAVAPSHHFDVLLTGLNGLKAELNWFQEKAAERHLNIDTTKHKTCQAYCDFLESIAEKPYAVIATAFWAIESAYSQAWQFPGEMSQQYAEFAKRWGNPQFVDYVKRLEYQADKALQNASEIEQQEAEEAFLQVATLEKEFWQMAFDSNQ